MSPVTSNRVLTSPTALAAVLKSVGIFNAISSAIPSSSSRLSPVAPVFFISSSIASSTSDHALALAVPSATIPAETGASASPTPAILSPTLDIFCPSESISSATFANIAEEAVGTFLSSSSRFFNSFSVCIISLCQASYCSAVIDPFFKPFSISSETDFNCDNLSLVEEI